MTHAPFVIAGGGIAGPVAAIALARAGIPSIVYEASPTFRDDGGAEAAVDDLGFRNDRLVFQNERTVYAS